MRLLDYAGWKESGRERVDDIVTSIVPIVVCEKPVRSIEEALLAQPTILLSAIPQVDKRQGKVKTRDMWLYLVGIVASVVSIGATVYYYNAHEILLYDDSYSHLRIARAVFDSATPGLAQLGGVWLPLPHILMWPFVWNDFLWHSGLAGSFVSMPCYVATGVFIYLSAKRLTKSSGISFLATLTFLLNPNILYLQSTPLSELVCFWTMSMACYFFLEWVQEGTVKALILCAGSTFLATLSRYDSWAFFMAFLILIVFIGILRKQERAKTVAQTIIFITLGGLGILFWFAWNKIIFGDFLYFQHGPFSSQVSQLGFLKSHTLYTYHKAASSIWFYAVDTAESIGPLLCGLALIGLIVILILRIKKCEVLAILVFLTPFAFYSFSLYSGQAVIWTRPIIPLQNTIGFFNVRYGAGMAVPIAILLAALLGVLCSNKKVTPFICIGFLFFLFLQIYLTSQGGIISVQDGQSGLSCAGVHPINAYLAQHYDGGKILQDVVTGDLNETETGLDFNTIIYDGSGIYWEQALKNPETIATWIIADVGASNDRIAKAMNAQQETFMKHFDLVSQEQNGLQLWHHKGASLALNNPVPQGILTNHLLCKVGS